MEVDVVLPVFNAASTLRASLDSILRQRHPILRVIVIDDGSTDNTPLVLRHLASRDNRIKVLTKSNGGIVDALNAGLQECSAEFVARQDADDLSDPNRIEAQVRYLSANPDCVAVSGAAYLIDEYSRNLPGISTFDSPAAANPYWAPAREPYLLHPFLMVRRSALLAVGGYRYVYNSEDSDLYWRLQEFGRLHNLQISLGHYRMHSASISSKSILNGRIMAVSSQLAAISAGRRRTEKQDLSFPREALGRYLERYTLSGMCEEAKSFLSQAEMRFFKPAVAGKLLELSAYRPYELDLEDCRFIQAALVDVASLTSANRVELKRMQAGAVARLFRGKRFSESVALSSTAIIPAVVARILSSVLPRSASKLASNIRNRFFLNNL